MTSRDNYRCVPTGTVVLAIIGFQRWMIKILLLTTLMLMGPWALFNIYIGYKSPLDEINQIYITLANNLGCVYYQCLVIVYNLITSLQVISCQCLYQNLRSLLNKSTCMHRVLSTNFIQCECSYCSSWTNGLLGDCWYSRSQYLI